MVVSDIKGPNSPNLLGLRLFRMGQRPTEHCLGDFPQRREGSIPEEEDFSQDCCGQALRTTAWQPMTAWHPGHSILPGQPQVTPFSPAQIEQQVEDLSLLTYCTLRFLSCGYQHCDHLNWVHSTPWGEPWHLYLQLTTPSKWPAMAIPQNIPIPYSVSLLCLFFHCWELWTLGGLSK